MEEKYTAESLLRAGGPYVACLLKEKGYTLTKAASEIGISDTVLNTVVNRGLATLEAIAEILNEADQSG